MTKKLLYFFTITAFFLLTNFQKTTAKEYCHLHLNNELFDTVELPFYLYKLDRIVTIGTGMPSIDYSRERTFIDSLTKCELINEKVTYSIVYMQNASIYDYSSTLITIPEVDHFDNAKITASNTILKGFATKEDEEAPIINGYKEKYTTNIDKPLDLNNLIKTFNASDNFDGNISSNIKIEFEDYNKNKIGLYTIIISVEDNAKNKTTTSFLIEVIDTTPPIISGKNDYISYFSSPLTIEEIKNNLKVEDNVDYDLSSQIFVCEDLYSPNKDKEGTYSLFFCAYDNSNNLSNSFNISIEVKDDIPPIIEGLNKFDSYLSNPLTIQEIMYTLAASDNNKDISNSIFLTNDLYSSYKNTTGEKKVYFQAMDEAKNLSLPFEVTINLIDDIPPQIYGLNIYTSYLSSPLSLTYLKQQLTVIDNIDGSISASIEILNDSYSNNLNNKGKFHVTFIAKDSSLNTSEEFKLTINTIDDVAPYFEGTNNLTYRLDQKPTLDMILGQYKVIDNVDLNLEFEVIEESYSSSFEIGTFFIKLKCKDSSNNESLPFIIKVELVDEIIKLNELSIILPTSYLLSIEEINKLINLTTTYTIIENTYSENFNLEGTYSIKYKLKDKSLINLTITTYNQSTNKTQQPKKSTTKKETFINKIKRFFSNLLNKIKAFLKKINPLKVFLLHL